MKDTISKFCKSNKSLSAVGIMAILYVLFYYFTYNLPELWPNAHILVEILFQLSLALIANLIFYISQVYIPQQKNRLAVKPIVNEKVTTICSLVETLFSNFSEEYLGNSKDISKFSVDDMRKILEQYRLDDHRLCIGDWTGSFGEISENHFREIRKIIDDLLTFFPTYFDDGEKDSLIQLKADHFYELLISPFTMCTGVTRIVDEKQINEFRSFQQKYEKVKKLLKHNGEDNYDGQT